MDMVGEGVEQIAQVIALQDLGCDYAQGFFFSRASDPRPEMLVVCIPNLSLICNTQGALVYANQWNDRLTVFHAIEPTAGN